MGFGKPLRSLCIDLLPIPLVVRCTLLRKRRLCPASRLQMDGSAPQGNARNGLVSAAGLEPWSGHQGRGKLESASADTSSGLGFPAEQSEIFTSTLLAPSTSPDSLQQNFGLLALFGIAEAQIHNLGRGMSCFLMRTCFWLAHESAGRLRSANVYEPSRPAE